MKTLVITLAITLASSACHDKKAEERAQQYEQQLAQERQSKGNLKLVIGLCISGAVILFVVGTALGSRTRRHEEE